MQKAFCEINDIREVVSFRFCLVCIYLGAEVVWRNRGNLKGRTLTCNVNKLLRVFYKSLFNNFSRLYFYKYKSRTFDNYAAETHNLSSVLEICRVRVGDCYRNYMDVRSCVLFTDAMAISTALCASDTVSYLELNRVLVKVCMVWSPFNLHLLQYFSMLRRALWLPASPCCHATT